MVSSDTAQHDLSSHGNYIKAASDGGGGDLDQLGRSRHDENGGYLMPGERSDGNDGSSGADSGPSGKGIDPPLTKKQIENMTPEQKNEYWRKYNEKTLLPLSKNLIDFAFIADGTAALSELFTVKVSFKLTSLTDFFKNTFAESAPADNRLNHIFGKVEHNLTELVEKYGSEVKAYEAVQKSANTALKQGKLTPNSNGILPNGNAGNIIQVGGMNVRLIGGKVKDGQVIISSLSRKGL